MGIEEKYPADYNEDNIKGIVSKLDGRSCLTLLSPSGFAKSYLLRYLATNKNYRKKYKELKKIEFIYIDIHEISIEKGSQFVNANQQQVSNEHLEVEKFEKLIYLALGTKVKNYYLAKNTPFSFDNNYTQENLLNILKELSKTYKNKLIYIIFDSTEKLLSKNYLQIGDFLNYLRDFNKGRIEYIFTLDSTRYLNTLDPEKYGRLAYLLVNQIYYIKLDDIKYYQFQDHLRHGFVYYLFPKNRKKLRDQITQINKLAGGYFPYAKYLYSLDNLNGRLAASYELQMSTKKLLASLTTGQIAILRNIIDGKAITNSLDLEFLLKTGLVKSQDTRFTLFSPIFEAYLKIL